MFENIDLSRPLKDPLVVALQLLQKSPVVRGLLEVWKGDAGSQVDLISQWLPVLAQHYRHLIITTPDVSLVFIRAGWVC